MVYALVYDELKRGDRVAYLTGRRPQTCVVTEVERVTATQLVLANGQRARRADGALVGDHYTRLCDLSWPSIVSVRIAMEHRRLESELHRLLKAEESTSRQELATWHHAIADLLDDSCQRLIEIAGKPTKRGTSNTNTNARGGSPARRSRKQWLLDTFGDGEKALCSFGCGTVLTIETITVDRHPIPGADGGTYRRDNIRPACQPCQSKHGGAVRRTVVPA